MRSRIRQRPDIYKHLTLEMLVYGEQRPPARISRQEFERLPHFMREPL